jgi:hypothetical protein
VLALSRFAVVAFNDEPRSGGTRRAVVMRVDSGEDEDAMDETDRVRRTAEVVDVQLLDVLSQVEAVLRHGRELQREALRLRGVPSPVSSAERVAAVTSIRGRVDAMHGDCLTLCIVVQELRTSAQDLERVLGT